MKNFKLYIVSILFSTLLTGCVTVTMLNAAYPAKQINENIDVYITNKPSCEYIEIAIIKGDDFLSESDALNQIKVKARQVGADAIIITGNASTSTYGVPIGNTTYLSMEDSGIKVIAIKYKDN